FLRFPSGLEFRSVEACSRNLSDWIRLLSQPVPPTLTALVVSLGLDLDTEHQSCCGLSGMSGNIRVQRGQLEVGPVVHESAILGTERDVFHMREISAAAVNKCSFGLPQSSRHGLACIVGGVKHQRTRPGQNIGVNPVTARQSDDQCGCGLMGVGLNVEWATGSEVLLGVAVIAIVRLR